jgi:SAM-dependent methyltransferase
MRRRLWKVLYELLAWRDDDVEWAFMNYGFADLDSRALPLPLAPSDEKDRLAIQLYHHVAASVDLAGRDVLEVGCGRGGGASYIARYLGPRMMVGVDFSREAIVHCRRHRRAPGLSFACGDAESLPFTDGQFHVVVNIESSHCYGSLERFLDEAYRVLRPDGLLLFADFRFRDDTVRLRRQLRSSRFRLLKEQAITRNVVGALEREHEHRLAFMRRKVPAILRTPFLRFAGVRGTPIYEMLRGGQAEYISCVLHKVVT